MALSSFSRALRYKWGWQGAGVWFLSWEAEIHNNLYGLGYFHHFLEARPLRTSKKDPQSLLSPKSIHDFNKMQVTLCFIIHD